MMKAKFAAICTIVATTLFALPARAQTPTPPPPPATGASYIGPSLSFGGGDTVFGVNGKFPLTSNLSLRPSVQFPSGGVVVGSAVTYDFTNFGGDFRLDPFAGVGVNVYTGDNNRNGTNVVPYAIGGVDLPLTDQFILNGNVNVPLTNGYSTNVGVGIAYRF